MNDRPHSEVRWLERGAGASVVLLHGLMGGMHDWVPVLEILGDRFRAIAPALPTFDAALADVSVAGLARWVLRVLDALGLRRVALVGNSLGSHVALRIALAAPERVSALVLTGSSGLFGRGHTRGVPCRPSLAFVREKMESVFFDRTLATDGAVAAVRRSLLNRAVGRLVRMAGAARRDNLRAQLHASAAPTLLVWGREDRITPLLMAERFQAAMPGTTLIVLRRCGHAPMIEQPEAFGAIALAWLEEQALAEALR